MEYDNTNRGIISKNQNKTSDKHPDHSGSLNVDGVDYWLSGWIKEGKNGKFLSLSVKPKDQQKKAKPKKEEDLGDFDQDVPF
jgi:hypothetical protein